MFVMSSSSCSCLTGSKLSMFVMSCSSCSCLTGSKLFVNVCYVLQ